MIEENKIALFDAYHKDELSGEKRQAFEQRLEKESVFRLEYEEEKEEESEMYSD